jgi:hypothetical protein
LCSSSWPQTQNLLASRVLGLQACTTVPNIFFSSFFFFCPLFY